MDPQCEVIGKYVLPIFRSLLAKELVQKYHLSQTETAKKLVNDAIDSAELTADFCGLCSTFCQKKAAVTNLPILEYYI